MEGKLNTTTADKKKIIGEAFDGEHNHAFGYIESISPLCILSKKKEKSEVLLPASFSYQEEGVVGYQTDEYDSYFRRGNRKDENQGSAGTTEQLSPILNNFNYKTFSTDLRWMDGSGKAYEPFNELKRVGVKIKGEEDAFYKQKHYGLKKGFSFGVWFNINEKQFEPTNNLVVPFGGDQGLSKLTIRKDVPCVFDKQQQATNTITLLSDAFVDTTVFDEVDYGITEYVDFRYIKYKSEKYYNINNQKDKSDKMQLLKRGSILFCKDGKTVADKLRKYKAYRRIGYNYFKFI